jgi:hypothetical protein
MNNARFMALGGECRRFSMIFSHEMLYLLSFVSTLIYYFCPRTKVVHKIQCYSFNYGDAISLLQSYFAANLLCAKNGCLLGLAVTFFMPEEMKYLRQKPHFTCESI